MREFILLLLCSDTWLVSEKTLQRLALSYAVSAGSREVVVTLNSVGECTVLYDISEIEALFTETNIMENHTVPSFTASPKFGIYLRLYTASQLRRTTSQNHYLCDYVSTNIPNYLQTCYNRWSSGSALDIGPKVQGLEPGRKRWIFKGDKNP
jgi:hypothetical protein